MPIIFALTLNFILYLLLSYKYWKKGKVSLTFSLSIFYTAVAFMGIIIIPTGIYETVITIKSENVSFIPYLLCFISVYILIKPLEGVYYSKIAFGGLKNEKLFNNIINFWIIDFILWGITKIYQLIITSSMGFYELYNAVNSDGNIINVLYGGNHFLLAFEKFNINLQNSLVPFILCYAFYKLIREGENKKSYFIIGLVLIVRCLAALSMGSRGNLFFTLWSFVIYYVLFFPYLNNVIQKKFIHLAIFAISIIILYLGLITIDRLANSDSETPLSSVLRYFGEAFPNLGNSFWDNVNRHPYGSRLFPDFFGSKYSAESVHDGYKFWEYYTGVPVLNFKTIFGDLYIEFGTTIALIIITTISCCFKLFLGCNKQISFWKLSFILWYFELVLQGIFGFVKSGHSNLIIFIAILLVSLFVKLFTFKRYNI